MPLSSLWNSPEIPPAVSDREDFGWALTTRVDLLSAEDTPSSSDNATLFERYNSSSSDRDAIDAAFVWMTGYTLATIAAMVATPKGKDYEQTLAKWRKNG